MRNSKHIVLVVLLILQIVLLSILKYFPQLVESYYSKGLYVYISKAMRYSFGWIPFSAGDIFYTAASIYFIRWFIINRKRIINDTLIWFLEIGAAVSIIYIAFHLLWGFNYYRLPLSKALHLQTDYTDAELINFTERLIKKSNAIHSQIVAADSIKIVIPYSKAEIRSKVPRSYDNLNKKFPYLEYSPPSLKPSIYSTPLSYMGFSGYLNPFTNEGQVNNKIVNYKLPTTACHEAAHQLGYAAENEANFIGAMAAIANDDIYFKYSGYTFILRYCLADLYRRDIESYQTLIGQLHTGVLKNYREVQLFWESYQNPFEPIFEKTFDQFLKANNQKDGMKTYSYVVALMVNYFYDKNL